MSDLLLLQRQEKAIKTALGYLQDTWVDLTQARRYVPSAYNVAKMADAAGKVREAIDDCEQQLTAVRDQLAAWKQYEEKAP